MKKIVAKAAVAASTAFLALCGNAAEGSLAAMIARDHKVSGQDVWCGHRRTMFVFKGRKAWVVEPSVAPLEGRPWTWTMQWATAFVPRTGVPALLSRGFHHVTIELFDTRMDDSGVAAAAEFQKYLVEKLGFAPKANLVGMSWGGFFSVRYAAAHPDNVRRIYLDAPLLNFTGFKAAGSARGIGSWFASRPAGGDWTSDPRMPGNMAGAVAKAGIPVLLLYGGKDVVVPPDENCRRFAAAFKAAGGKIEVHERPSYGHHPHGADPGGLAVITDFFTK
jgi:pimeloyl-ACP methyl ester carboxylesterase